MKKLGLLLVALILVVGCEKKEEEPSNSNSNSGSNSNPTVTDSSLAELYVQSLIDSAEQLWVLGEASSCIDAKTLSTQEATGGMICMEDSMLVAKSVTYDGFICNGQKSELSCVKTND